MATKRVLNVVVQAGTTAHANYHRTMGLAAPEDLKDEVIAPGFRPRPDLDMTYRGGHIISDLVFVNCYLAADRWDAADRTKIDDALSAAMADPDLENVIAQYFTSPISSAMLASQTLTDPVGDQYFKDNAEAQISQLFQAGVLGQANPASTIICLLLPPGAVLVDGLSTGAANGADEVPADGAPAKGAADAAANAAPNAAPNAAAGPLEKEEADSKHGLGGYHGSVEVAGTRVYYAIAVYSEGDNGIAVFDESWKNVVATLYHELNEARTDADVEVVNQTGDMSLLGWYSEQGGEIGDIPMSTARDIMLIMKEVPLTDGSGTVPVQLEWSNAVHGPEGPISTPH